eukprot:TRINITY_DN12294_c0_g1_i6.p1 TRINITY_DN12294_c0_g1~~TRINITY_DN12294_c0_g1_i6.p1  ORF type:complete len:814 (+),score=193.92 TRINITY_DN12294_c0_g1_i6:74-2443(+)
MSTPILRKIFPALTTNAWRTVLSTLNGVQSSPPSPRTAAVPDKLHVQPAGPCPVPDKTEKGDQLSLEASSNRRGREDGSPNAISSTAQLDNNTARACTNVPASQTPQPPLERTEALSSTPPTPPAARHAAHKPRVDNPLQSPSRTASSSRLGSALDSGELLIEPSQDNDEAVVIRIASHTNSGQAIPCQLEIEEASDVDRTELHDIAPGTKDVAPIYILSHIAYAAMSGVISCHDNGLIFNGSFSFLQLVLGRQLADVVDRSIEIVLPEFYMQSQVSFSTSPERPAYNREHSITSDGSGSFLAPKARPLLEGNFSGVACHADGTEMSVDYTVKRVLLRDGSCMYAILITCLDGVNADIAESSGQTFEEQLEAEDTLSYTSNISHRPSLGRFSAFASPAVSRRASSINLKGEAYAGEFFLKYHLGETLGTGTFGFAKLARCKATGQLVVVKFLPKERIIDDGWEENNGTFDLPDLAVSQARKGYVPREALLLHMLDHANVAKGVELCHNTHYFQLVMEDHGAGFDLFTFVEDNPQLDEHIVSFIFRQIVDGMTYLHARNIVHRDIKDENVILNYELTAKLIDFGSAAIYAPDRTFETFAGTVEYCCPSVLRGNPYVGPEVDIFALGVTLYTMIFCEHPFFDVQETLAGQLSPPHEASVQVMDLIRGMLASSPRDRMDLRAIQQHNFVQMDVSEKVLAILEDPEWVAGAEQAKKEREASVPCSDPVDPPSIPIAGPAAPMQTRRSLNNTRAISVSSVDEMDDDEAALRSQILANMARSGIAPHELTMNQTF